VAEAMVVAIAILLGWPAPISTTQILWINLVTSVTLTLAFVFEPPHPLVMQQPSRARPSSWLNRADAMWIAGASMLQTTCVFLIFDWALQSGYNLAEARTAALNLLVMSEMSFMFNVRMSFATSNRVIPSMHKMGGWALATLAVLQLLLTYWPSAQQLMATAPIDLSLWLALAGMTLLQFLIIEAVRSGVRTEAPPPKATS
jgi:magnesium-transporting ATPase (P-type)